MKKRLFALTLLLPLLFSLPLHPQSGQADSPARALGEKLFPGTGEAEKTLREAFVSVPREDFLDGTYRNLAYRDMPLPAGGGMIHPSPSFVSAILKEAKITVQSKILVIGRNTAYLTRIISQLTPSLFVSDPRSGSENQAVYQRRNDLSYFGWIEESPFDCIIIFGAVEEIPRNLVSQLSDNGRIIGSIESETGNQILVSAVKFNGSFSIKSIGPSYIHKIR